MFRERLEDYGLESFQEVKINKRQQGSQKTPEDFVLKILKEEQVIEKARIIKMIFLIENDITIFDNVCDQWSALHTFIKENGQEPSIPSMYLL